MALDLLLLFVMGKATRFVGAGIVMTACLLGVGTARADEPTPAPTRAPETKESTWYGYQTIFTDLGAIGLMAGSFSSKSEAMLWTSVGVYAVGAPVVHAVHGRPGIAAADVGIRVVTPVVTGAIGLVTGIIVGADNGSPNDDTASSVYLGAIYGTGIGIATGAVTAMVLDAAVLAHEPEPKAAPKPASQTASIRPALAPSKNGFSAGVVGTF